MRRPYKRVNLQVGRTNFPLEVGYNQSFYYVINCNYFNTDINYALLTVRKVIKRKLSSSFRYGFLFNGLYQLVFLLAGISMHKGYAFVQFTNPFDARSACLGEDGRTVLSQILGKLTISKQVIDYKKIRKLLKLEKVNKLESKL